MDARRILFTCRTLSLLPSPAAMTFEFDEDFDKRLLAGSGIALASYAVVGAAAPAKLHELYMERVSLSSWRGCWPSKGPVCRRRCRRRCFGMVRPPALAPLPCPTSLPACARPTFLPLSSSACRPSCATSPPFAVSHAGFQPVCLIS